MNYFEKIFEDIDGINHRSDDHNVFNDADIRFILEPVYDSFMSSLVNRIRNDAGTYDEMEELLTIRNRISKESKKQYNIIISFCKEENRDAVKVALEKYNFFHFLKYAINILDVADDYDMKVEKCKKYFSDSFYLAVIEKLYRRDNIPVLELRKSFSDEKDFLANTFINDLLIIDYQNGSELCSLSPEGKNLYAFFMMKNIDFKELSENYNESKVNEILEYLLKYILTNTIHDRHNIKKPLLYSVSANENLNKVITLLDQNDSYNSNIVIKGSVHDSDSYRWKGGNLWNT